MDFYREAVLQCRIKNLSCLMHMQASLADEQGLTFLGVVGMHDPPRGEVRNELSGTSKIPGTDEGAKQTLSFLLSALTHRWILPKLRGEPIPAAVVPEATT